MEYLFVGCYLPSSCYLYLLNSCMCKYVKCCMDGSCVYSWLLFLKLNMKEYNEWISWITKGYSDNMGWLCIEYAHNFMSQEMCRSICMSNLSLWKSIDKFVV